MKFNRKTILVGLAFFALSFIILSPVLLNLTPPPITTSTNIDLQLPKGNWISLCPNQIFADEGMLHLQEVTPQEITEYDAADYVIVVNYLRDNSGSFDLLFKTPHQITVSEFSVSTPPTPFPANLYFYYHHTCSKVTSPTTMETVWQPFAGIPFIIALLSFAVGVVCFSLGATSTTPEMPSDIPITYKG